jgi:hypothetical protein
MGSFNRGALCKLFPNNSPAGPHDLSRGSLADSPVAAGPLAPPNGLGVPKGAGTRSAPKHTLTQYVARTWTCKPTERALTGVESSFHPDV